jgi:hypothetical protein
LLQGVQRGARYLHIARSWIAMCHPAPQVINSHLRKARRTRRLHIGAQW